RATGGGGDQHQSGDLGGGRRAAQDLRRGAGSGPDGSDRGAVRRAARGGSTVSPRTGRLLDLGAERLDERVEALVGGRLGDQVEGTFGQRIHRTRAMGGGEG